MKTIIFGIDGVSKKITDKFFSEGVLPNLKKLADTGYYSECTASTPPSSMASWSQILTGKQAGKTSMFGNLKKVGKNSMRFTNAEDRDAWDIYEILSEQGKKGIVLGVPETHPARNINGFMVSLMKNSDDKSFTHPDWLARNAQIMGVKPIPSVPTKQELLDSIDAYGKLALHLLYDPYETGEYEYIFLGFIQTEYANHVFYRHAFKGNKEAMRDLKEVYERVDWWVGRILKEITEEKTVFIISDHGHQTYLKKINLNALLHESGYLYTHDKDYRILESVLYYTLGGKIFSKLKKRKYLELEEAIDFTHTTAWSYPQVHGNYAGLYIKKEKQQEVLELLRQRKEIESITPKEHLYSGEHLPEIPDFIIKTINSVIPNTRTDSFIGIVPVTEKCFESQHGTDGIFIANGKNIKPGNKTVDNLSFTPTILASMNAITPHDLDGKAMDIFNNPPKIVTATANTRKRTATKNETQEEVRQRLENLGYI